MPYEGRNFNPRTLAKCFYFVICIISRHWFRLLVDPIDFFVSILEVLVNVLNCCHELYVSPKDTFKALVSDFEWEWQTSDKITGTIYRLILEILGENVISVSSAKHSDT